MAQDQVIAALSDFGVVLDAGPPLGSGRRLRIVIADDQVLPPVQLSKQVGAISAFHRHEIAEMPDLVILPDDGIPVLDQCCIMRGHVWKRTTVDTQDARIREMRVSGEEDHRLLPELTGRRVAACARSSCQDRAPDQIDDRQRDRPVLQCREVGHIVGAIGRETEYRPAADGRPH